MPCHIGERSSIDRSTAGVDRSTIRSLPKLATASSSGTSPEPAHNEQPFRCSIRRQERYQLPAMNSGKRNALPRGSWLHARRVCACVSVLRISRMSEDVPQDKMLLGGGKLLPAENFAAKEKRKEKTQNAAQLGRTAIVTEFLFLFYVETTTITMR